MHNVNHTANAEISIYHKNDREKLISMNYCMITYDKKKIFIGRISNQTFSKYIMTLEASSKPTDEETQQVFDQNPIHLIFNHNKKAIKDILLFDSKMNAYNLTQYKSSVFPLELEDSNIYDKEYYKPNNTNKSKIQLNIRWVEHISSNHKILTKLSKNDTERFNSHMNKTNKTLPAVNKKFGKYIVVNNKGKFTVRANIKHKRSEIWNFNTHISNLKDFHIYLDGSKYVLEYKEWKEKVKYYLEDKVIKKDGVVYECIKTHNSDSNGNNDYWVKYINNDFCNKTKFINLFGTDIGVNIRKSFMDLLDCYIQKNSYNYMITVSGPWEKWSLIEVMNIIKFKDYNNKEKSGRIISYEKIWKQGKQYIKFVIYYSEYKQPELTQIKYYVENYFQDEYINKSIFEEQHQFLLQKNNIEAQNVITHQIHRVGLLDNNKNSKIQGLKIVDNIPKESFDLNLNFELYRKEQS